MPSAPVARGVAIRATASERGVKYAVPLSACAMQELTLW